MIHWKYLRYLLKHKWFVAVECWKRGLYLHAITHDLSKFRPSEWIPYARYFYGDYPFNDRLWLRCPGYPFRLTREGVEFDFDRAWLRHQHRNKHHWQYWILREDEGKVKMLPMPHYAIVQMVCDWIGASKAIRGKDASFVDWYLRVRSGMDMEEVSRNTFEMLIGYVNKKQGEV